MQLNGIILIDKEEGMTSRDVDNFVGKKFGTKRVGHLGTLDPFATGLLIIAINKGTKLLPFISDEKKTYVATLVLGKESDSGDKTGNFVKEMAVPTLGKEKIIDVLQTFLGKSKQIPPIYSAIKVNGKPLYKYAFEGVKVEIKEKEIEVYSICLQSFIDNLITFEAVVSKGTYIRTLGEDIAKKLGTVGFLSELRRTESGPYKVNNAIKMSLVNDNNVIDCNNVSLIFPSFTENDDEKIKCLKNGKTIHLNSTEKNLAVYDKNGYVIAICEKNEEGLYFSKRGLF